MLQVHTCAVRSFCRAGGIVWTRHATQWSAQIEIESRERDGHDNIEVLPDSIGDAIPVADLANVATKPVKAKAQPVRGR